MENTERNKNKVVKEEKEWFIILDNQQAGPFCLSELKKIQNFTPDTLVWKKGFKEWTKARFISEIKNLFKDDPKPRPLHEKEKEKTAGGDLGKDSQVTLTLQNDPHQFFLWILLLIIIIFCILFYRNPS